MVNSISILILYSRSQTDELWKRIEDEVLNSSQDFEGKIKIPSTFQEIMVKLESAEVFETLISYVEYKEFE